MKEGFLFDFDGTLTSRDLTRFLVLLLLKERPQKFFIILPNLLQIKFSKHEEETQNLKNLIIGKLIKGLTIPRVEEISKELQKVLKKYTRSPVKERLDILLKNNRIVLIVSASPEFSIKNFIQNENLFILGTSFEVSNSVYTGEVGKFPCYGKYKVKHIHALLNEKNMKLDFEESWSDSVSDLPMMELAKKHYWVCKKTEEAIYKEVDPLCDFIHV